MGLISRVSVHSSLKVSIPKVGLDHSDQEDREVSLSPVFLGDEVDQPGGVEGCHF